MQRSKWIAIKAICRRNLQVCWTPIVAETLLQVCCCVTTVCQYGPNLFFPSLSVEIVCNCCVCCFQLIWHVTHATGSLHNNNQGSYCFVMSWGGCRG